MSWLGAVGSVIGGIFGSRNNRDTNSANLRAVRETNATNVALVHEANRFSRYMADLAHKRDWNAVRDARQWDAAEVRDARQWDASQAQQERQWNKNVADIADSRDRNRFLADRSYSEQQAKLAEQRDRSYFLENRNYEWKAQDAIDQREQNQFLENRRYTAEQSMAAERRQRTYQAADLADARAYADPAAERARLEAAGFNPLGRSDISSGMSNLGGAIANAPAAMAPPSMGYMPGAGSPSARAAEAMGMSGSPVPAGAGSAASQIARSQMAKMGVFDPAVSHMSAPIMQADNSLGDGIADAFASYSQMQMQEKEYALRKSQLEIEQSRLSELMQRASMRPVVGGVYSRDVGIGRQAALDAGASSSPSSPRDAGGVAGTLDKKDGYSTQRGMRPAGIPLTVERKNSDAQQAEDRYGEIASEVVGLSNIASDAGKTINQWWKKGGKQALIDRAKEMASFPSLRVREQRPVRKKVTTDDLYRQIGIGKYRQ